jgi:hypothetical protein
VCTKCNSDNFLSYNKNIPTVGLTSPKIIPSIYRVKFCTINRFKGMAFAGLE